MARSFCVYILASRSRTLYTGITNNLQRRLTEHREGKVPGFTRQYRIHRLVHFEQYDDPVHAIAREKEIKGWRRVAVLAAGAGLIVGIAGSRLLLNAHSALEVGIGVLIGSVTLGLFASRYLSLRSEEKSLRPLILPAIAVITLLHGHELHAEGYLHAISRYLHLGGSA